MFRINKKKIRPQQLQKQFMLQEKEHRKNSLILPNGSHTKPIQKKKKQPLFGHKKKQEDKFSRHLTKDSATNPRVNIDAQLQETPEYWFKNIKQWHLDTQPQADACIEEEINKLPILSSIQELFSLSSSERLTNQVDVECFYRYCKTVSFLEGNDAGCMVLLGDQASGVGHIGIDRQGTHVVNSIFLLSLEEAQAVQKRASFMEKIKENESKYDASIGRMSEISKELAFNYRVYLQKRSQLVDSFNCLSAKIPPTLEKPYSAQEQYAHLLIKKNLKHAFSRGNIDPLNYFKFKEHIEVNRADSFRHIMNPEELKMFIDRRKPKRGRKLHLATACSVCLSDYHELSNPFQSCSVCGLRAHKMCFSFENSKCGYCAYQKIERNLKEQVSPCFICKQRGLMTIKLGEREFAHGFCLLMHGFWRLKSEGKHEAEEQSLLACSGAHSSEVFLQLEYRKIICNQIEFTNPNQNCTAVSLPAIDSTIYASHQIQAGDIESDSNSSLGMIGIIGEREEAWQHAEDGRKGVCKCCHQGFYKNCYLSCETCQQQCHILCAFLSGFDLKLSGNASCSSFERSISLNCCCEDSNQVAWSRKYKLNYERIAFNIDESLEIIERDPMKNDKETLLFNI